MIKATELRIGNIVKFLAYDIDPEGNKFGEPYTEVVDLKTMEHIIEYPEVYDPVPLTPEILEKCGFEKDSTGDCFTQGIDRCGLLNIYSESWKYSLDDVHNEECYKSSGNRIEYLHQLQNLYFSLNGEELIVKL